ncbi:MAG: cytochrome b [Gallionella sp.]|nr:cytochrome b [Gallionella sp.]MDD4959671.1 cytochrome b [Gallionella sp.]
MITRYTYPAMALHWLMALLIFVAFPLGIYAHELPFSPLKLQLISYHKWLGVTILGLLLLRVIWRLTHTPPALLATNWQRTAAHGVHGLIYALLLAIPLSGWLMSSAKGIPVVYFELWQLPDLVSKNKELGDLLKELHEGLNIGLLVLVALHIAAALKHHLIDKDSTLRRMLPF